MSIHFMPKLFGKFSQKQGFFFQYLLTSNRTLTNEKSWILHCYSRVWVCCQLIGHRAGEGWQFPVIHWFHWHFKDHFDSLGNTKCVPFQHNSKFYISKVMQAVCWPLYIVAKWHFFTVVPWKYIIKYLQKLWGVYSLLWDNVHVTSCRLCTI